MSFKLLPFLQVLFVSDEPTRRALQPPNITDASDDDRPDEILNLLGLPARSNYPPVDCNLEVVKELTAYGRNLATKKVVKSVILALITGISAVLYTWILLNAR